MVRAIHGSRHRSNFLPSSSSFNVASLKKSSIAVSPLLGPRGVGKTYRLPVTGINSANP